MSVELYSPEEISGLQRRFRQLPFLAKELLAGGLAGGLAKTCVAPLERVKILFQTGRTQATSITGTLTQIYSSEGLRGLFRGNGASVLRIVPYSAFHFGAYEHYRTHLIHMAGYDVPPSRHTQAAARHHHHHTDPDSHHVSPPPTHHAVPPVLDLLAGSAAGATAVLLTYPLDFARTRLAYEVKDRSSSGQGSSTSGPADHNASSRGSVHSSAANASANGNQASAGLHHPFRTDQAAAQKQPHTQLWQSRTARPGLGAYDLWHPLTSGSTSFVRMPSPNGGSAALSVQRFNHAALPATQAAAAAQRSSISSVLAQTVKAEGPQGIYRGIAPTLAGILPYAGLKFYVYQSLKQYYRRAGEHAKDRLPIAVMLSFGASAGLVAQTITYPLDVVRRQMQVQGQQGKSGLIPQHIDSTLHGLKLLWLQGGRRALFRGLSLNYIKVVPSTAIGFAIYDYSKQYLNLPQNL